jgi:hypothetical protein
MRVLMATNRLVPGSRARCRLPASRSVTASVRSVTSRCSSPGFFSDSFNRSLVDIDYYIRLGERAYRSLAHHSRSHAGDVFDELSDKFSTFVDVLGEVSERTSLSSNSGRPPPL